MQVRLSIYAPDEVEEAFRRFISAWWEFEGAVVSRLGSEDMSSKAVLSASRELTKLVKRDIAA